ncbi:MAG: phage/plasmid replication protein [bacterium]
MIDSVLLQMKSGSYRILDHKYFNGRRAKQIVENFTIYSHYHKQTKAEKDSGEYMPQVEIYFTTRGKDINNRTETLEIQVSLPKLIYGTSLLEISHIHLQKIYLRLQECFKKQQVEVSIENLQMAILKRIDFSKNIIIPDWMGNAQQIIRNLSSFDHKPRSEFKKIECGNDSGVLYLKFFNTTQGYVIYAKMDEIAENGQTSIEKQIKNSPFKNNVLRFELSLEKKQSLEAKLRQYIKEKRKDFTLDDLFKSDEIAKNILLETFDTVFSPANTGIISLAEIKESKLEKIFESKNIPFAKQNLILRAVNLTTIYGIAMCWKKLRQELKGGNFGKTKKEIKEIVENIGQLEVLPPKIVNFLRSEHERFDLYYPQKNRNNICK